MASYDDTLKATLAILARYVEPGRVIRPEDHVASDLGLDSLGIMEAIADAEDQYGVHLSAEALSEVQTVEDLVRVLVRLRTD